MRFIDRVDGPCRRTEQLHVHVAFADLVQPFTKIGDGRVVRVEQTALSQQGVDEGVSNRSFDRFAEFGARDKKRVNIHTACEEREASALQLLVVDRDQCQVDIGLGPYRIVREATAENCSQNGPVAFHLGDEIVKRLRELFPNPWYRRTHFRRSLGTS